MDRPSPQIPKSAEKAAVPQKSGKASVPGKDGSSGIAASPTGRRTATLKGETAMAELKRAAGEKPAKDAAAVQLIAKKAENSEKPAEQKVRTGIPGSGATSSDASADAAEAFAVKDRKTQRKAPGKGDSGDSPESAGTAIAAAAFGQGGQKAVNAAASAGSAKADDKVEAADAKKKDKRKERIDIEVYDQRKGEGSASSFGGAALASARESGNSSSDSSSSGGADLTLTLKEGGSGGKTEASGAKGTGQPSFADALARELRESYNNDIVQRAAVVLKDGGEGMIRLALKPESLGSVKIRLELAENKIAGRIVVESDEALKAFSKELHSLEQAFVDGGFDGASIELALSSGNGGGSSPGDRGGADSRPFFSDRLVASEYGSSVIDADTAGRPSAVRPESLVDMLA